MSAEAPATQDDRQAPADRSGKSIVESGMKAWQGNNRTRLRAPSSATG